MNPPINPLPSLYLSTGVETRFINGLDPDPKTRAISANLSHIHRPETLIEWIAAETLDEWVKRLHAEGTGFHTAADDTRPASFRARLQTMPPLEPGSLYPNQVEAVTNLEQSLRRNRPRALRWEKPDEDLTYDPNELDRRVVAKDQIRPGTPIGTYRGLPALRPRTPRLSHPIVSFQPLIPSTRAAPSGPMASAECSIRITSAPRVDQ